MEEVDAILLNQLRDIGCFNDFDEDLQSISSLDSYQIIKCVAQCLFRIGGPSEIMEKLPTVESISISMNMSLKYKYATQLSSFIKDLGYKSDIGYQTFMYSNEHELRRLLLFLIERISRDYDDDKSFGDAQNELSDRDINKSVLKKLKQMNLSTIWLPKFNWNEDSETIEDEIKYSSDSNYFDNYFISSFDLNSIYTASNVDFSISSYLKQSLSKQLQRFAELKLVSQKNTTKNSLLPKSAFDILEWNNHFNCNNHFEEEEIFADTDIFDAYLSNSKANGKNIVNKLQPIIIDVSSNIIQDKTCDTLKNENSASTTEIELKKEVVKQDLYETSIQKLKEQIVDCEKQISELQSHEKELILRDKEYQEKCKLLEASFKSKEELENGITTIKKQIEEIGSTWEDIQNELLLELKSKKSQNAAQNEELHEKIKRINILKKSISNKTKEIKSKELLVSELEAKIPQQWPPGRALYTKRIIEIIGNVKKQNEETKKVLLETKSIQKDINSFNGKIERSFTVAEETIFREAKLNEWNRKCYKCLALLQTTFTELLEAVSNIGVTLREIRQLEEMVENEKTRKTESNLARINADLEQIMLENRQLKQQLDQRVDK